MTAADPSRCRRRAAWALGVLALALVFFSSYHDYGLAPFDEGVHLEGIRLQAEGRLDPARFAHYSAQYRWFAAVLPGGEPNLELVRLVWVGLRSLTALLIFLVATRLLPSAWALLPVACFLALPGPWHKSIVPCVLCLCLWAMVRTLERLSLVRSCGLAVALALTFSLHPYTGAPSALGWLLLVAIVSWTRWGNGCAASVSRLRALRWHGPFALTLVGSTLLLADFVWQISPWDLAGHNATLVSSMLPGSRVLAARLVGSLGDPRTVLCLSLYLMVVPVLIAGLWQARPKPEGDPGATGRLVILCLLIVGALNLSKWAVRLDLSHLIQNAAPLWILLALILRRSLLAVRARVGVRAVASGVLAVALSLWLGAVLAFGVTSTDTFVGGIGTRLFLDAVPLSHPHGVLHVRPEVARTMHEFRTLIRDHSAAGDCLLISGSPKILHYLSGRPSPVQLPAFVFPAIFETNPEGEVIAEIRARNTSLVLFDDQPVIPIDAYSLVNLAPELYELIMSEYELVAEIDGVQVRVRAGPARDFPG